MGAAHVQQYRQGEIGRQRQLRLEQPLLALDVRVVDVVIQADLADGAELRLAAQTLQPVAQLLHVGVLVLLEKHRMQAQRRMHRRFVTGQLPDPLPVGGMHPEHHDAFDTGVPGAGDYLRPVIVEHLEVEVGMSVDQLHEGSMRSARAGGQCYRDFSGFPLRSGYR